MPGRKYWEKSSHPDYSPLCHDTLKAIVDTLSEDHDIFGIKFVTHHHHGNVTSIVGFEIVSHNRETGVRGITEFDIHGFGIRDTLLYEV